MKQERKDFPTLAVFAGGMRIDTGATSENAASVLWKAFPEMGYDAMTLSSEDLPDLDKMPEAARKLLTLANVAMKDGARIAPPVLYKDIKAKNGKTVKVAFIGLLGKSPYLTVPNPETSPADQPWKVSDPEMALKATLPEARKKADLVVVLFSGMREPARDMVRDVSGVDVMVVGMEGAVDEQVEKIGNTAVVQSAERGRSGSALGITLGAGNKPTAYSIRTVPLDSKLADDPDMAKYVQEYRDLQVKSSREALATQRSTVRIWAGSAACANCHAPEYDQWKTTKHAHAMETLEAADNGQPAQRADCVKCHTVGFGQPDGYLIAKPRWELRGVGCEMCHGPAAAHVAARMNNTPDPSRMVVKPAKDRCIACHNADNSPNFDYDKYLARVVHKQPAKPKPVAAGG